MDKSELIISALQQRIGEMSAHHELEKAIMRAEITMLINESQDKEKAIKEYSETLTNITEK